MDQKEELLREVLAAAETWLSVKGQPNVCVEAVTRREMDLKKVCWAARSYLDGQDVPLGMMPNATGHQWPYILQAVVRRLKWAAQDVRTGFRRSDAEKGGMLQREVLDIVERVEAVVKAGRGS